MFQPPSMLAVDFIVLVLAVVCGAFVNWTEPSPWYTPNTVMARGQMRVFVPFMGDARIRIQNKALLWEVYGVSEGSGKGIPTLRRQSRAPCAGHHSRGAQHAAPRGPSAKGGISGCLAAHPRCLAEVCLDAPTFRTTRVWARIRVYGEGHG